MIFYEKIFAQDEVHSNDDLEKILNSSTKVFGLKIIIFRKDCGHLFEIVDTKYINDVVKDEKYIIFGYGYTDEQIKLTIQNIFDYFINKNVDVMSLNERISQDLELNKGND